MPIHIPPISRRRFLAGSIATGAGLLLPWRAGAEESAVDPNRWALLADTHIFEHLDQAPNGIKPAENFAAARDRIIGSAPKPAGAIVAGDCACVEGQKGDYAVLAELVRPLREAGVPLHLVLGNHDHRENCWEAFPEAKPQAAELQPIDKHISIVETPHANWFLLDSLHQTNYTPGRLGRAQLDWLAMALDARPNKPALLVGHHFPSRAENDNGLLDAKELFEVLVPRKQVKAYIFGHSHQWSIVAQQGIHLINLPTLVWTFDNTQPRGWVDAQLRPDGITLTLNHLDPNDPKPGDTMVLGWRT